MIQTPVLPESLAGDATFAILSAGQAPGPSVAKRAAKMGAEVVVLDRDPSVLADLMSQSAERVGGLALSGDLVSRFEPLHRNWGATPLQMVLNLMPLDPEDCAQGIDAQIRGLSALVRALGRGLVAGQGSVVTVLSRPSQPLALAGYGMIGAVESANAALDKVFGPRGLHFHLITVPEGQAGLAADTALYLGSEAGRRLRSGRLDLG
ncbi:hypothetical protein WNY61_15700 [Sulfitobacter sp. AS92]|uniref:hypothetical protein n=1 Tax=Sulfitobacter sp. AS92 TaxID=3135783 RepID=UPI00316FE5EC